MLPLKSPIGCVNLYEKKLLYNTQLTKKVIDKYDISYHDS